ncbi:hypothetical protein ABL78_3108 [Leptomonas seymouri]|uniref:Uncharacterized protein n=1 Tax=Leptomonas seymouri TaxID=5684 RepID=A0A0N0P6N1_LEPSE|nr:hypothetical protein ABL78_3108 [Leptomonas seymouri]|eukprot:KPI87809.1 hypothetical protein ABL78_3108 [Leptomonas seymouri]
MPSLHSNTALCAHPPRDDSKADACAAAPPAVPSASSTCDLIIKVPKAKRASDDEQLFNPSRPAEEELAELSTMISSWREKRLIELQEESRLKKETGVAQVEATMEKRIQQRREAERLRARQRMGRLLDTLGPRLEQCLQNVSSSFSCVENGQVTEPNALRCDQLTDVPTTAPQHLDSPMTQALVACARHHVIGCQQLSVEERDSRNIIERSHRFAVEVSQLVADETQFRCYLETWEDSWSKRLMAAAAASPAVE